MDNQTEPVTGHGGNKFADLYYYDIQTLDSHLLRLANLAFSDNKQRKAFIATYRRTLWLDWANNLEGIDKHSAQSLPVGMPDIEE